MQIPTAPDTYSDLNPDTSLIVDPVGLWPAVSNAARNQQDRALSTSPQAGPKNGTRRCPVNFRNGVRMRSESALSDAYRFPSSSSVCETRTSLEYLCHGHQTQRRNSRSVCSSNGKVLPPQGFAECFQSRGSVKPNWLRALGLQGHRVWDPLGHMQCLYVARRPGCRLD